MSSFHQSHSQIFHFRRLPSRIGVEGRRNPRIALHKSVSSVHQSTLEEVEEVSGPITIVDG
jgi:hypothetical protein